LLNESIYCLETLGTSSSFHVRSLTDLTQVNGAGLGSLSVKTILL
jgi:hypothetical protein